MSRHVILIAPEDRTNNVAEVAYGFDPPISSYFWQEFDADGELIRESPFYCSKIAMLEYFETAPVKLPEQHRDLLMLDLPI